MYFVSHNILGSMTSLLSEFKSLFVSEYIEKLHLNTGTASPDLGHRLEHLFTEAKSADVIMSRNEELEDVSTSSLLFTLLPFAIGDIKYTHSTYIRETRLALLSEVEQIWTEFSYMMEQLQVREIEDAKLDPRSLKIAASRRQDLLKPQVKLMAFQIFKADLDDCRECIIDCLEYFAIQCANDMRFLKEEKTMLQMMPTAVERIEPVKKPWSMKLDKSQVRKLINSEVFRPDIYMPTMTLDEFARLEMEAVASRSSAQKPIVDFNYHQQETNEEQQQLKDRAWDDWKDNNTRGSGNKMTNIG